MGIKGIIKGNGLNKGHKCLTMLHKCKGENT